MNVIAPAKARVDAESAIACRQRDKKDLLHKATWTRNQQAIIDGMQGRPWMSQKNIRQLAHISGDTARPIIVELVKNGVLKERATKRGFPEYRLPEGPKE